MLSLLDRIKQRPAPNYGQVGGAMASGSPTTSDRLYRVPETKQLSPEQRDLLGALDKQGIGEAYKQLPPEQQARISELSPKAQAVGNYYKEGTEANVKRLGQEAKVAMEPMIDPFRRLGMAGKWAANQGKGLLTGLQNPAAAVPKQLARSGGEISANLKKAGTDVAAEAGRVGQSISKGITFLNTPIADYGSVLVFPVAIFVIMALGLNIVIGKSGLLDLGYVAFFAIGAYTMGILGTKTGLNSWEILPIGIAMAMFAGLLLGVPALRLRGDYLAIITLGFGEIVRITALNLNSIGGANGIVGIPTPPTVFGLQYTFDFRLS